MGSESLRFVHVSRRPIDNEENDSLYHIVQSRFPAPKTLPQRLSGIGASAWDRSRRWETFPLSHFRAFQSSLISGITPARHMWRPGSVKHFDQLEIQQ